MPKYDIDRLHEKDINTIFVPIIINKLNLFYEYQVNGSWGEWEQWEDCTASCDGGNQSRSRVCDSPEPAFGGTNCTDDGSSASETQRCNENNCTGDNIIHHVYSVEYNNGEKSIYIQQYNPQL